MLKTGYLLSPYNSEEKLLSEIFLTYAPDFKHSDMTTQEMNDKDISIMQEPYEQYKADKNDMGFNKYYYDGLLSFVEQYKELKKWEIDNVKNALIYYNKLNNSATEKELLNYINASNIPNKDYFLNNIKFLNKYINIYSARAREIYNYSISYEKNKKALLSKIPDKYIVDGDIKGFLVGFKTPKQNGVYKLNEDGVGFIQVLQNVPDGIIISAYSSPYADRPIFIVTNRNFADDEIIREQMYLLYDGYYHYTTILGATKKIWKFKEISKATYDNIADKQSGKYYFIK